MSLGSGPLAALKVGVSSCPDRQTHLGNQPRWVLCKEVAEQVYSKNALRNAALPQLGNTFSPPMTLFTFKGTLEDIDL